MRIRSLQGNRQHSKQEMLLMEMRIKNKGMTVRIRILPKQLLLLLKTEALMSARAS